MIYPQFLPKKFVNIGNVENDLTVDEKNDVIIMCLRKTKTTWSPADFQTTEVG